MRGDASNSSTKPSTARKGSHVTANSNPGAAFLINPETNRRSFSKIFEQVRDAEPAGGAAGVVQRLPAGGIPGRERDDRGLESVFQNIFPITSTRGHLTLEYLYYMTGEPKYTVEECQERGLTFSVPLKVKCGSSSRSRTTSTNEWRQKEIVEHPVYLGELPKITDKGTFIINGAERVIVSQLHRSPGVFFDDEIHPNGTRLFNARIIPYRGSWVEFSTDINDIMYIHIDRKRKQPVTVMLRALGFETDESILELFHDARGVQGPQERDREEGRRADRPHPRGGCRQPRGRGESRCFEVGDALTEEHVGQLIEAGITKITLIKAGRDRDQRAEPHAQHAGQGPDQTKEEALRRDLQRAAPGRSAQRGCGEGAVRAPLLQRQEVRPRRGRPAQAQHAPRAWTSPSRPRTLTPADFLAIIQTMINLRLGRDETDDIDHFGNRRVRSVGELLSNQFSVGLSRMARIVKERMNLSDKDNLTPARPGQRAHGQRGDPDASSGAAS